MRVSDANLGAANLLRNKNKQIEQSRNMTSYAIDTLGNSIVDLRDAFDALSERNTELENLLLGITKQGVASEALGTIHVLKAKALQRKATNEHWTTEDRRQANLKLAAEAEYDYRLKNDPSYRLTTAAESLMTIASQSENGDMIRKTVSQMFATGKVRKIEEKDKMIAERIADMNASARYATDKDTLPMSDSISPMRLEVHKNNPEKENTSEILDEEEYTNTKMSSFIR